MSFSVTVQPHEGALLLRDGRPSAWLGPGRHRFWSWSAEFVSVTYNLDQGAAPLTPELLAVLPKEAGEPFEVPEGALGLVRIDGRPTRALEPGRYVLWTTRARVTGELLRLDRVLGEVPEGFARLLPPGHVEDVVVPPHERVLLQVDGTLHSVLTPGRHFVFRRHREVTLVRVDLREREVAIQGQEVLTADKASIRVNLVVKFRVDDPVLATEAVADLHAALYSEAQLLYRRQAAGLTVEQLLERRNDAAEEIRAALEERARAWGVQVLRVDLKDLILPGDMKALFQRVIEAEKQAQAQNILRREETAATRSLANTARLLEANPTLLRLKELETWKEMATKVGQVTVVVSPQQLAGQLGLKVPGAG